VAALEFGLVVELADQQDSSSTSPVISWRADRSYALVVRLVVGLASGLTFGLGAGLATVSGFVAGFRAAAGFGVGFGTGLQARLASAIRAMLMFGLVAVLAYSQVWPSSLAQAQLAMRRHTPLRLMAFLEDAHERNVLRAVGPVYQFRCARLQTGLPVPVTAAAIDAFGGALWLWERIIACSS